MKNHKTIPPEVSDAMNHFAKRLPDPDKSFNSTIKDEILVNQKKVTFMAQKRKGEKGMCWDIRYQISISDKVAD